MNGRTWRRAALVAMLAVAVTAALAAATAATPAAADARAQRGGTLRLAGVGAVPDPAQFDANGPRNWLLTALTLVSFPDEEGALELVPAAAAAMPRVSADRRTYTFTIRRGLRFSDGSPVTAASYETAFRRMLSPEAESYGALLFSDVLGATDFSAGKTAALPGVVARGDTLVVRLVAPRGDFLARLTMPFVSATPAGLPPSPRLTLPLPTAGPYVLSELVPGRSAVFTRNPYWRRDLLPWRPANVDRIVTSSDLGPVSGLAALVDRDELDFATLDVPEDELRALVARHGLNRDRLHLRHGSQVFLLTFNLDRPLFRDNPGLARAVNYALDRHALALQHGYLQGRRTDQLSLPGLPGYRNLDLYPRRGPDLERARALARGNLRGGTAVLWTWPDGVVRGAPGERVAGIVRHNLRQIGLEVEVRVLDPNVQVEQASQRDAGWDILFGGWIADYPDQQNLLEPLLASSGIRYGEGFNMMNFARFRDPAVDRRLREAARLPDAQRLRALSELERDVLRDRPPYAAYLVRNIVYLVSPSTGCFARSFFGVNFVAFCKRAAPG